MASLLLSASPWEGNSTNSKKKATMKKLVYGKKNNIITRPPQEEPQDEEEEVEEKPQILLDMDKNAERHNAVHSHIKEMPGPGNAGDFLATFKPVQQRNYLLPNEPLPQQPQHQAKNYKETFSQNNPTPTTSGDKYSNYNVIYQPQESAPYYTRMGLGESNTSANNDKLMEKINYLIHLLEEQQSEKTNYVMEEFLLYGFLGIFMIFIVDSFSRAGKYVR